MHLNLKKILFMGAQKDKKKFYQMAQQAGVIHFDGIKLSSWPEIPILQAIHILMNFPRVEQEEMHDFDAAGVITERINQAKKEWDELSERLRMLDLDIERVHVFGDFNLEEVRSIESQTKLKFHFLVSKSDQQKTEWPEHVFYVGKEFDLKFYLAIDEGEYSYDEMIEVPIDSSLSVLLKEKQALQNRMHVLEAELKSSAKYSHFLHQAFYYHLNDYNLNQVQESSRPLLDDALFSSYGWVPVNQMESLMKIGEALGVYIQEVAVEEDDNVPTCLENKGLAQVGEELVRIYDTPGPKDKDPSIWVLSAFSLFFAMIIGDAGYGLIYLMISLYLWYRFPRPKGMKKRLMTLMSLLSSSCIVWGILTNSYFGIEIPLESPIRSASGMHWLIEKKVEYALKHKESTYAEWVKDFPVLKEAKEVKEVLAITKAKSDGSLEHVILNELSSGIMMELSIVIGLLHICCSFGRYLYRNWSGFGWIPAMIGAYLYFPHYVGAMTLSQYVLGLDPNVGSLEGLYLLLGGVSLAVGMSIIQHGYLGLLEIMSGIQIFSDVMSYLRLFALGLAGSILSSTINGMIGTMPFVVVIFLVVFSHVINMGLGLMSGTIHGLRLNFLEWYHYSFDGGGKPFQPLKVIKMD